MFRNKVLVVKTTNKILFFKWGKSEDTEENLWVKYDQMESQGSIFGVKDLNRFAIIETEYIRICEFKICDDEKDKEHLKP